jgi:uncharacterized protein YllA (UPF0747 family)
MTTTRSDSPADPDLGDAPGAIGTGLPLGALGRYSPAFVALAAVRPELDPYLPSLGRFEEALAARRAGLAALDREPLWGAVGATAGRLGAPEAAGRAIEALRSGAPAVVSGQQPGLLGGPVFALYKAATAVVIARELSTRYGETVVPIFWSASDFRLGDVPLDPADRAADPMVGHLPTDAGRPALEAAREALASGPGGQRALDLAGPRWERGADWGEGFAACLYALLGDQGLVVVDAREPALRELASPLIARYLDDVEGFAAAIDEAGESLERGGLGRQIGHFAAAYPLWHEEPPCRRRLAVSEEEGASAFARAAREVLAREDRGCLWPGIALRPLVVDHVLPALVRVLGPAEVTYMAQLAPAYRRLEIVQPPAAPRLTATLMPQAAARVAAAAGAELGAILADPGATLAAYYRQELPPAARRALEELESGQRAGFAHAREALGQLGRGLDQLVDSVAGKVDFQLRRLWEAAIKREKSRREADDAELRHLAAFLRPDQGLQERRLSLLAALALSGERLTATVLGRAEEEWKATRAGKPRHHLIGVEP